MFASPLSSRLDPAARLVVLAGIAVAGRGAIGWRPSRNPNRRPVVGGVAAADVAAAGGLAVWAVARAGAARAVLGLAAIQVGAFAVVRAVALLTAAGRRWRLGPTSRAWRGDRTLPPCRSRVPSRPSRAGHLGGMTMPDLPDAADFVALAAEFEKEGQYNAAKLARAAAAALLTRRAHRREAPTDPADQADWLDDAAGRLDDTHLSALAGPMRNAAAALRAGRVALIDEAPDPYVCRICGEVRCEPFTERCPHCGRWPSTAERIRPIYWLRESKPTEAVERLRRAPETVARLLGDGTDPALREPGPDGGWSAHQVLEHLHNAQMLFRGRIDQLIAGGDPELASVMVWTMEETEVDTAGLLGAYAELRAEIVGILSGIPAETWQHTGRHEEWGRVTLAEQASYFANHEPTHLAQLADAARR